MRFVLELDPWKIEEFVRIERAGRYSWLKVGVVVVTVMWDESVFIWCANLLVFRYRTLSPRHNVRHDRISLTSNRFLHKRIFRARCRSLRLCPTFKIGDSTHPLSTPKTDQRSRNLVTVDVNVEPVEIAWYEFGGISLSVAEESDA